jgi:hypothetical protein
LGQTEKNSVRANVFRVTPESGPCSMQSALRICTKGGRSVDDQPDMAEAITRAAAK